ncbi:MAG: hypothetical protein AAF135_17815, partial [Bacteroidota bacterium]
KGVFMCYHYSKLWHGIYVMELTIDFDSLESKEGIPTYSVKLVSGMTGMEETPIISIGEARHEGSNLHIDVRDKRGIGLKKMIYSVERGPNTITKNRVFLGMYLGVSRDSDIICGTICMRRKEETDDVNNIPPQILRYLFLDKWQKRIPLEPLGYELEKIPLNRDPEDLLQGFVGNYRFCWLSTSGGRLVESQLRIENSYNYTIKTFMSKKGVYSGRFFVQNTIACLNSIGLRKGEAGVRLSASVFFDILHIPRQREADYIYGSYNLAGLTNFPKFGYCLLEKIKLDEELDPQIYMVENLGKRPELMAIYHELIKKREKDYGRWKKTQQSNLYHEL